METYDVFGRRGSVAATWCALMGIAIAAALVAPMELMEELVLPYASSFATALTVLFVAAWTLGDLAGRAVFARGWSGAWTGWFLAVTCLALAVFAGSLVTLFVDGEPFVYGWGEALFDYVYKPLFWVMAFGLIPCAWLAWLFAKLLMKGGRDDEAFDRERHDGLIWGQMFLMIAVAFHIIVGMFFMVAK